MKKTLCIMAILVIMNLAILGAVEVKEPPTQTREDVYKLIKEELTLTVDIYKAQVDILNMILDFEQKNLAERNAELSKQIGILRNQKVFEGKTNEDLITKMQEQLDLTRSELASANLSLDQMKVKIKQTEGKILDYYLKINKLAQKTITEVEKDKNPKLPAYILTTMKANQSVMDKANITDGMNQKAFEGFQKAAEEYIIALEASGGKAISQTQDLTMRNEYWASAQASQVQYSYLQAFVQNLEQMLADASSDKEIMQRRLDELRAMPFGKTYEDRIYFDSGSVVLDKNAIKILEKFATSAPTNDDYEIMITGFCDNTPIGSKLQKKYASNWELSLARSSAVVGYMLGKLNFPPEKIIIAGKGEFGAEKAMDDKLNRKVEFRFVPKAKTLLKE